MAVGGKVKGITIEFDGDTTKLGNALKKIDTESKSIDRSLKQVNNALKFNPKNTELVAQKQTLLKQKIDQTNQRLDALRATQKKLDADPSVDKTSQDYMELRREIITTESKLNHFEGELKKMERIKFTQLGQQFQNVGNKMKSAGKAMSMYVTAPIVAGYTLASKYASDYEENLNKLDVAFGKNAKSVKAWAKTAGQQYGLSQVQATDAASAFGALAKGIGATEKDAAEMSTTLAGLSADLGSYFNVGIDQSSKALEGIFTGESEALKKFGVVMTDTNLQQFAKDQGRVWKSMSQTEKTALRYQYVLEKTKDAQGDFSRTSDGTANSLKIFQASLQDLATAIGKNLLPIITPIIQKITQWIKKFSELSPETQKIITIVGMVAAVLGPVIIVLGHLATGIGAIIKLLPMLGAAFKVALGPIGIIITAIGAAIAIGIALYKNWDKVKAFLIKIWNAIKKAAKAVWDGIKAIIVGYWKAVWTITKTIWTTIANVVKIIWNGIKTAARVVWNGIKTVILTPIKALKNLLKTAWNSIKNGAKEIWEAIKTKAKKAWEKIRDAIVAPIQEAKDAVKKIVDKIKELLNFGGGKKVKLPSVKGKLPSVSWNAKGGIFDSPSIIGVGEAGPEAVIPLSKLKTMLGNAGNGAVITNNITINGAEDPEQYAARLARQIKLQLRTV